MAKTCVITFGRFNPPTSGHEKLFNKMEVVAKRYKGEYKIFTSRTFDNKKNPLKYNEKLKLLKQFFPKHKNAVTESTGRTIIEVLKIMSEEGEYNEIVVVVGSDRVKEFNNLITKYNGSEYQFDNIKAVSAGVRDPDSDEVDGMSASKVRAAASSGDWKTFEKGLPKSVNSASAQKLFKLLRSRLPMTESRRLSFKEFVEAINKDVKFRTKYQEILKNEPQE